MNKRLAILMLLVGSALAQKIDLGSQTKGTLPPAKFISGTLVGNMCLRTSSDASQVTTGIPCIAVSDNNAFTGTNSHSGSETFSGAASFSGTTTVKTLNKVLSATQFAGGTADVQINACIAAVIAVGGGTCDGHGYGHSTQTIASAVSVGNSSLVPVSLVLDLATTFVPSGSADMFRIFGNGSLTNLHTDTTGASYVGTVVTFVGPVDGSNYPTALTNAILNGGTTTTGTAISMTSTSPATLIEFASIDHVRIHGMQTGLQLVASGSGWVNGNSIRDVVITDSVKGLVLSSSNGAVEGNHIHAVQLENGSVHNMANPIQLLAPLGVQCFDNQILASVWDFAAFPAVTIDPGCSGNLIMGEFNGTIVDNGQGDTIYNSFDQQTGLGGTGYSWMLGSKNGVKLNGSKDWITSGSSESTINYQAATNIANNGVTANAVGFGWNASNGGGEMDLWTAFIDATGTDAAFNFYQNTGGGYSLLGSILRNGQHVAPAVKLNGVAVGSLPAAASNAGVMMYVTDSTTVSAEGQTCVGSSSNKALAFSNGTVWKCF